MARFMVLTSCCFCLPLWVGLVLFGIINLFYVLAVIIWGSFAYQAHQSHYRGYPDYVRHSVFTGHSEILLAVYCFDAVLFIVLLLGASKRNVTLLKIVYACGVLTILVSLVLALSLITTFFLFEFLFLLCGIVAEVYLLMLLRSMIILLEDKAVVEASGATVIYT